MNAKEPQPVRAQINTSELQLPAEFLGIRNIGDLLHHAQDYAVTLLPTFAPNHPGLTNPKLERVLTLGDYQNVDPRSDEYGELQELRVMRQKIARGLVLETIENEQAQVQLSPEKRILLTHGLKIQNVVDDIYLKWHAELVRGEDAEEICQKMEDDSFMQELLGPHGNFLYGLLRKTGPDNFEYLRYNQVYAQEIEEIASHIDAMVTDLTPLAQQDSIDAKSLIAVNQQWKSLLLNEGSPNEVEQERHKLDIVWTQNSNHLNGVTTVIQLPFETYVAEGSVEWQYDINFISGEHQAINDQAELTKQDMIRRLEYDLANDSDFANMPSLQGSLDILKATSAAVYLKFISGTTLGFRSGAANLPNGDEARLARDSQGNTNGSRILFDYVTFEQRAEIQMQRLNMLFGEDRVKRIFGNTKDLIPHLLGTFLAGHEDGHVLSERARNEITGIGGTLEVLGKKRHIDDDELKADIVSLYTCLSPDPQTNKPYLPLPMRQEMVKAVIAEELRGLTRWSERNVDASHLNGNRIVIQAMLDSGIIRKVFGNWRLNLSERRLNDLAKRCKGIFIEIARVYEQTDSSVARRMDDAFHAKYLGQPSKLLLQLLRDDGTITPDEYQSELHGPLRRTRRLVA